MKNQTFKRQGFSFWEGVIVLAILVILAVLFFPTFGRGEPPSRTSVCKSNLKQIMLGAAQYVQDANEHFPPVATANPAFGWADALQPYLKATQIFQCPAQSDRRQSDAAPAQRQYTDYWFNARLSRVETQALTEIAQTIALGEGNDGKDATDARYHLLSIPEIWRKDENSPLHRHLDGANFAFADGHVKWLPATHWKGALDATNGYTFRLNPQ